MSKVFNGIRYELMSSHRTKEDAKEHAKFDKRFGYKHYRIVKYHKMWVVYETKKGKGNK